VSPFVRNSSLPSAGCDRRPLLVGGFAAIVLVGFLLLPGNLAWKTHVVLHGLCAQRPSHSLQIGGVTLPMDARMTGIYLGAAVTILWLIAARRLRATRVPSLAVLAVLALFVVALAVDGFNALLVDLRFPTPYEPSKTLRMATGILGGTSLGVTLGHLFAASMWAEGTRQRAVVTRPIELLTPIGVSGVVAVLAFLNIPLLYGPFAVGLLVAAVGVFWLLTMVVVALVSERGWSCRTWADFVPLALTSLVVAMVEIGALSWLRIVAEQLLGLPKLT
jgi:uncharacterized membrane protein